MLRPVLLMFALLCPAQAVTGQLFFHEVFRLPVNAIDATTFEVVANDGAGGTQMWCAAGIYVTRALGQSRGDITILEGYGPSKTMPGRRAVVFTTNEVVEAFKSYDEGVRKAGKALSIGHATGICGRVSRVVIVTNGRLLRR